MNWTDPPATESQPAHPGSGQTPEAGLASAEVSPFAEPVGDAGLTSGQAHAIKIGKTAIHAEGQPTAIEIFTMTLGKETIQLLPLKNWGQLDVHKWTVRGKLPGTPAGLDVTFDHVKLSGEKVSAKDPEGCAKLEKLFDEWLAVEKETIELAKKKTQAKLTTPTEAASASTNQAPRFHVEVDKTGQVHIQCIQGKEIVAAIGLNLPGFSSLFSQGLMRKPHTLKTGALHDWVELDGVLCSFEKGRNDAAQLEQLLNGKYLPESALGRGKDIVVFANAASSTGFDIQFPITLGGTHENRRRHLNQEALDLLQEPVRCGLLQSGIIIKLTPPCLIFKQKTPDGGEQYLRKNTQNLVTVTDNDGQGKTIDLSQPVNFMHLNPVELTALFNHPAINKHGKVASQDGASEEARAKPAAPKPSLEPPPIVAIPAAPPPPKPVPPPPPKPPGSAAPALAPAPAQTQKTSAAPPSAAPKPSEPKTQPKPADEVASAPGQAPTSPTKESAPSPNLWLKDILAPAPMRHDWFVCLVYRKIAEKIGNSREGTLGPTACWAVALSETKYISEPAFKGVFLTAKHGFGFINQGRMVRFNGGVVFLGTLESALEATGVGLVAVGLDAQNSVIFITTDGYRSRFEVPAQGLEQELSKLRQSGAAMMSIGEVLQSAVPLELVWTVPADQKDPNAPQVLESARPADASAM